MAILCKPEIAVPENILTLGTTLELCRELHADHPQLQTALRLIHNTGVKTRHLVRPISETLIHDGLERRNAIYEREAKDRCPPVIRKALANAQLEVRDIDAIIFVSCTGFLMPSLSSWLINQMGFRLDCTQIPIAQMGCAAGGHSINRAHEYCVAYPDANVLIVACEFCSLCYQPEDKELGNLVSNALFADAVGAAVVRGEGGVGARLEGNASYIIPNTEDWISYVVKPTGFHFRLDKRVPKTMEAIAPAIRELAGNTGWDAGNLDFYIIHAGGPRILSDLALYLQVPLDRFKYSRATLESYGNIASVVVFDALRRAFDAGLINEGARGMIAGFGPGIAAEMSLCTWAGGTNTSSMAA
jgi:1,3,6,8-tetrahydroxynaphthalene synthase